MPPVAGRPAPPTDGPALVRVVAGGIGLIGAAVVRALRHQPGELVVIDQLPTTPTAVASQPGVGGPWRTVAATLPDDAGGAVAAALGSTTWARAELYVCTGRVGALAYAEAVDVDSFRRSVEDNLVVAYAISRAFALGLRARGLAGSITIASSVGAQVAHRYQVAYDAAHAGIHGMTRAMAVEFGRHGVRANAVAIGPLAESPSTAADGPLAADLVDLVPVGRYGTADEIAAAMCAVGSDALGFVNGAVLTVDGGLSVQLRPVRFERRPGSGS